MKELFDSLPHVQLEDSRDLLLLDTCFVLNMLHKHKLHELFEREVVLTSFNVEELLHVAKHQSEKAMLRRFIEQHPALAVLDVPVHAGDWAGEEAFVRSVDSALLLQIPDASDAVLIAAAMKTNSDVLTKDKHHLFTTKLTNFLSSEGINVWKEWKDVGENR